MLRSSVSLRKEYGEREWSRPDWDVFYAAVAAAEVNSIKLVSAAYLIGLNPIPTFIRRSL